MQKNGIYEALKKFHKDYYSANLMTLVIYHNQHYSKISEKISDLFGNIQNKEVKLIPFSD